MLKKRFTKKSGSEARWLMTFADLITLLFTFFVYLSLFTRPEVNLDTHFLLTKRLFQVIDNPSVQQLLQPLLGRPFDSRNTLITAIEGRLGTKTERYRKQIMSATSVPDFLDESSGRMTLSVVLNEKLEEDLKVPLFFSGDARKGIPDSVGCSTEAQNKSSSESGYDYFLESETILIKKGQTQGSVGLCIINDSLYEDNEQISIQIGRLSDLVDLGKIITRTIFIADDESKPKVAFDVSKRDVHSGIINVTARMDKVSGVETRIPLKFSGAAQEKKDFVFLDAQEIVISAYQEKGSIGIEILQEDVPEYASKSLIVAMDEASMDNVDIQKGRGKQVNTIVGTLEMKDCSGINRFLKENRTLFNAFELHASKSRCILSLPSGFLFVSGGDQIKQKILKDLHSFLRKIKSRYELEGDSIRVEGHTDDVPMRRGARFKNNWELSVARATNIAVLMIDTIGYDPNRINIVGHADTRPKVSYLDLEGNQKKGKALRKARIANRRVDLIFTQPELKEKTRRFFP